VCLSVTSVWPSNIGAKLNKRMLTKDGETQKLQKQKLSKQDIMPNGHIASRVL